MTKKPILSMYLRITMIYPHSTNFLSASTYNHIGLRIHSNPYNDIFFKPPNILYRIHKDHKNVVIELSYD